MAKQKKWFDGMQQSEVLEVLEIVSQACVGYAHNGYDKLSEETFKQFKELFKQYRQAVIDEKAFWYGNKKAYDNWSNHDYELCGVKVRLESQLHEIYIGVAQ
jgi:hypothetical protein